MSTGEKRVHKWAVLLLLFVSFCIWGEVLLPQKAEAVTRQQALDYRKKLAILGCPYVVRSNGTMVSWNWDGTWRTVPEHVQNDVATVLGPRALVIKNDGSMVYFADDPDMPAIAKSDIVDIKDNFVLKSGNTAVDWRFAARYGTRTYSQSNIETIACCYGKAMLLLASLGMDKKTITGILPYWYEGRYWQAKSFASSDNLIGIEGGDGFKTTHKYQDGTSKYYYDWSIFIVLKEDGTVTDFNMGVFSGAPWITYDITRFPDAGVPEVVNCTCPTCGSIVDIAGNPTFFIALKSSGKVVAWKYNKIPNPNPNLPGPALITEPELLTVPDEVQSDVVAIQANLSSSYALALKMDGSVIAWDANGNILPVPEGFNINNMSPTVEFTSLPANSEVHKSETLLNFSIKATDPDGDQNLNTVFYLDTGSGFKIVNKFTANGISYNEVLPTINGTTYSININKTPDLIPTNVNNFRLKAVIKDQSNAQGEAMVSLSHYNTSPSIETSLNTNQKISKHEPAFSFSLTAYDEVIDQNLNVELFFVIEGIETRVNKFTAGGVEIEDGNLVVKRGQSYNITIDKSMPAENPLLPNTVDNFKLKAVVRDGCHAYGFKEISLIHDNALPLVEITKLINEQRVRKSENILDFGIKVTDEDTEDFDKLAIEIYIQTLGSEQKVAEFTVDGILYTQGKFIAQSRDEEYSITLNKGVYVPLYANQFILKVIATDSCGEKGEKEVSLVHYTDVLAQWALDSIKERWAVDSGGQSNYGIIHGASLTTGIISNAVQFDGIDDYIEVPLSPSLTLTTNSFSVEAWVKTSDVPLANDGIVNNYRTPTTSYWGFSHLGDAVEERGKFAFSLRDENSQAGVIKTQLPLNDGLWHHLVGVRDAEQDKMRFYVDGVLVDEADAPPGNVNSGQSIFIGEHAFRYFQGCIDEVTLYDCALSAEEVWQNYQKVIFLENIEITNGHNDDMSHPCTFGSHINKIEFDLKKTVNELTLEFDLPSSIKLASISDIYKDEEKLENPDYTIVDGNKIIINQALTEGHYRIQFFISINEKLIMKTKSYSDELKIKTNYESQKFELQFMDFDAIPDIM